MNAKKRFLSYILPHKKFIVLISLMVLIYVAAQISQPFLIGRALNQILISEENKFIVLISVCAGLLLFGIIANFIFEYCVGILTQKIIKHIRDDVYQKINSVSIETIHNKKHGDLLQLEIGDIENVMNGLFSVFKTLIEGLLAIVITIIMMFLVNWILALLVIILTPLSIIVSRFIAKSNHKYFKKQSELQSELNALSLETLSNNEVIQSLNFEDNAIASFEKQNENLRKEAKKAQFAASWVNPSTRLVNNTIYAFIGIAGIIMIYSLAVNNTVTSLMAAVDLGILSSFLSYTTQYTKPFNEVSGVLSEYETAKYSFIRINDFLNENDDIDEGKNEVSEINTIEFKDMSFSYDKDKKLIEHFNQVIHKGNKVAIVGPTGAGKSTLINLLMRFYDPDDGEILFNDVSGTNISKANLRKNFGMVLQETWIFNGTILDNVRYAKPDASDEEVIEACKKSHADTFIQTLPYGYKTVVSAKEGLSEGERQMLAIARVMLLNPDIVILDEATSNVDTHTEKLISDAFDKMLKDKTSIVIAHRLSTIRNADIILVLSNGEIVEQGNHESLMKKKGSYYSLYSSQFK